MFSFVTHVRNQPQIVEEHLRVWDAFPDNVLSELEFVLIDDCSDEPVKVRRPYLSVYRSNDDMEWNYGCKNLGAKQAKHGWVLLTNADHVLTLRAATGILLVVKPERGNFYRVKRCNPDVGTESRYNDRPHIGTLLIHRDDLFDVGGYDEDFCGHYGHDDTFLAHCLQWRGFREVTCKGVEMQNHSHSITVPDADFLDKPEWSRDLSRNNRLLAIKRRGLPRASSPLIRFSWEIVS